MNLIKFVKHFTDISADFWGLPFISAVYNRGIVNGYEDMTFRPNDHIIYNDAFKMIVEAINYSFFAETNGGYPAGYQTVAKDLELVARDFVNYTHKVNRYEAGVLIYNVLDIPIARKADNEDGFVLMDGVYDTTSPRMTLRMLHDKSQTQE
ncbi:MAG TPA: S-layer homology domain-containing protein [Candidatus Ornithomonoglobus intestinigallinarum]|uniref:S-layer homology domain-containing protein n=1 Tax=Candidatus Ornithomonoglobus intestinigallinarum TaxID=2840894 RepID=A0A9D1H2Z8_9FIRM|nr:S-layer homology domain-containing protein [Candidatus Ornithomonoglobus intestinigallinarum]